jgi:predicted dehydrogenase/NADPH:quinone reductase-like Zn-dependent oxidoreductase
MKQVFRRVIDRRGRVSILELPAPHMGPDQVLVQGAYSLISSGTESGTLAKTPAELVKQTIQDPWMRNVVKQTVFSTGLSQTTRRVWHEMVTPREIGYSGAGVVLDVGRNVTGLEIGQPVAYAAQGHAELAAPALNHVVPVPVRTDLRHAAFVTVGGIAMQSMRRADLQFGEVVAVYGLGLVGQICAQIALAAGCVVVGIDVNPKANELALAAGASLVVNPAEPDWQRQIQDFTGKNGVDATIICASSSSAELINASMEITRRQGRVVLVGYVKLDIHPKNFLYREIDLRYSRAFGPGSYHTGYEKGRLDYPFGYVRWTEKRNLEEFIRLISSGLINLEPLIARVYPVDEAQDAFDAIRERTLPGIAALLEYSGQPNKTKTIQVKPRAKTSGKVGISLVGFGNHVLATHLPNLRSMNDVEIRGIASASGRNAAAVADHAGATINTTDVDEVMRDADTDGVLICSTQPEHYEHIKTAVEAGKAVLVEKPMVTTPADLGRLLRLMDGKDVLVSAGLNRRYSPMLDEMRAAIPGSIDYVEYMIASTVIPADHWSLDPIDGSGRLVAEGEHFLDLCNLLIGRKPVSVTARALGKAPDDLRTLCSFAVTLNYEGAVATVVFNESGSSQFPRERLTAMGPGRVGILDDFGKLTVYGGRTDKSSSGPTKSMGHKEELVEFVKALQGKPNRLLSWEDASTATLCVFAAQESIRLGAEINLDAYRKALVAEVDEPETSNADIVDELRADEPVDEPIAATES